MAQMEEQQLHPGGDEAHSLPTIITATGKGNTQEEDHDPDQDQDHDHRSKKSVLAKVKEKALKWKNTLARKRHGHDNKGHETHSWEGNLDEEEKEEDPEYHGAPMYESEMAPEAYKETSSPPAAIRNELNQPLAHKTNNSDVHSTTTNENTLTIRTNKEHKESEEMAPETYKETSSTPTAITDGLKQPLAHETNESDLDRTTNEDPAVIRTNNEQHKETLLHHINTPKAPFSTLNKELATPRTPHGPKASPFHQTNHPKAFTSPSKELAIKHADQLAMHYLDEFEASSPRYKRTHVKFEDTILNNDNTGTEHNALEVNAVQENDPTSEAKVDISKEVLGDGGSKLTVETSGNAKEQGSEAKVYDKAPDEEHSSSKTLTETVTGLLAPAYNMVSEATQAIASKIHRPSTEDEIGAKMTYDKGVSVKEYLMHKLEPGEDERALSRAITKAISPRKATVTTENGVVEKVRNAVSTLLRKEGSEVSSIPVSTNPHAVEIEETGGRRLQAYAN